MKVEPPTPKALGAMLGDLLGRRVAAAAPVKQVKKPDFAFVSVYGDESQAPVAYCLSNLAFVCHAGAALSLIPASAALDALRAGKPSGELFDNFREVCNVLATVLDGGGTPVRLSSVLALSSWSAPEKNGIVERATAAQLDVEIQGYSTGKLAFVAN